MERIDVMNSPRVLGADAVLWEVIAEHVAEAEFAYTQITYAAQRSQHTLISLAAGPERRLLAHLNGLAVAPLCVREQTLLKPLQRPRNAQLTWLTVLCLALIARKCTSAVWGALRSAEAVVREAAEAALGWSAAPGLDAQVALLSSTARDPQLLAAALRLAARRGLTLNGVHALMSSYDDEVAAAAAAAARWAPCPQHRQALEALLDHPAPRVREAAMLAALTHGSHIARAVCARWAARSCAQHPQAALWLALTREPDAAPLLIELLDDPHRRADALFALGYAGQLSAIPHLLVATSQGSDHCKKLAGEAFFILTGYRQNPAPPPHAPIYVESLPELERDDLDADLIPKPVDELPLPDPSTLAAHWQRHAASMPAGPTLAGQPWTLHHALAFLRDAPLRRRHPVATWLALHSQGHAHVDTHAQTRRQQLQLSACSALDAG